MQTNKTIFIPTKTHKMPPKAWNKRTKRPAVDFIRRRATINYNESSLQQRQLEEAASTLQKIQAAVKRRPRRKRVKTQPEPEDMRKDGDLIPLRKEKLRDDIEIFLMNVVTVLQKNVTTIEEQGKTIRRLRKQRNKYRRKVKV